MIIEEKTKQTRLDQYVALELPDNSRASCAKLITQGKVMVNGEKQLKPGYKLRLNDEVVIDYDLNKHQVIEKIDLPVLYEDEDCVVINKPIGLLTHSKGAFNPEPTVATWLENLVINMDGDRAGIVHRLDRATSGVMICAKTPEALKWLQKQFSQRRTKKSYLAIIEGTLENEEAIIEMPIERNPKKPQTFRVGPNGKSAITEYSTLKTSSHYSLVELKPKTGRTHQLRVHMKYFGHPILGDTFYDGKKSDRLYLHAEKLEITLPSKERKIFHAPIPESFKNILNND